MNGGYQEPHVDQLMQANKGADFDFLVRGHSAAIAVGIALMQSRRGTGPVVAEK